jgi:hypothetical protein
VKVIDIPVRENIPDPFKALSAIGPTLSIESTYTALERISILATAVQNKPEFRPLPIPVDVPR